MTVSVRIDGLRELDAALGEMTKATARNVMRRALVKAGEPVAGRARDLVRVVSGQTQRSIAVSPRLKNKVGDAEYAAVLRGGGSKAEAASALRGARRAAKASGQGAFAEVYVGPSMKAPHAHLLEFGTSHSRPFPFMRPAWEQTKGGLMPIIARELRTEIDKAAARAARKAAKAAAKAGA